MNVSSELVNGVLVIRPVGRIDTMTAADFEQQCLSSVEPGTRMAVIDFASVDYISSAGLGALLVVVQRTKPQGVALTLSGLHGNVEKVVMLCGFGSLLGSHANAEEAAAALCARATEL